MATWHDVRRIVLALPETMEDPSREVVEWRFRNKIIVWERALRQADLDALGIEGLAGPVLGARVASVTAKKELIADDPAVYFTTPHFNGYPAVLVWLDSIGVAELDEIVLDAWLTRAPRRLARRYLESVARVRRG
jgi:hypothetical protein